MKLEPDTQSDYRLLESVAEVEGHLIATIAGAVNGLDPDRVQLIVPAVRLALQRSHEIGQNEAVVDQPSAESVPSAIQGVVDAYSEVINLTASAAASRTLVRGRYIGWLSTESVVDTETQTRVSESIQLMIGSAVRAGFRTRLRQEQGEQ